MMLGGGRRLQRDIASEPESLLFPYFDTLMLTMWGVSENNRRAKYYSITRAGRKQLAAEEDYWRQISEIMTRFLEPSGGQEGSSSRLRKITGGRYLKL